MSAADRTAIDIDRVNAILRMIAYSIDEARDLDADLLLYTLEVAAAAGAEKLKDLQAGLAKKKGSHSAVRQTASVVSEDAAEAVLVRSGH